MSATCVEVPVSSAAWRHRWSSTTPSPTRCAVLATSSPACASPRTSSPAAPATAATGAIAARAARPTPTRARPEPAAAVATRSRPVARDTRCAAIPIWRIGPVA